MSSQSVPASLDLTSCDREPIHIPSAIQSHGILLVLEEPDGRISQISANACDFLGFSHGHWLGRSLSELLDAQTVESIWKLFRSESAETHPHFLEEIRIHGSARRLSGTVHRSDDLCILELEAGSSDQFAPLAGSAAVRRSITELDTCQTLSSFCQAAAKHFQTLTGFDRTMVYKFMPDGSGEVIGEARDPNLAPYLGLRYPASDIPVQARQLYVRNPFRLTADVHATPVPLVPALNPRTSKPLDMSLCALRATSPMHLEYLQNMNVAASLSFSILHHGKLWGLVACHHRTARTVPQEVRIAGEILAQLVSLHVGLKEEVGQKEYSARLQATRTEMSERLRKTGDFAAALTQDEPHLLTSIAASGVALCTASRVFTLGITPDVQCVHELCEWVQTLSWTPIWSTDQLSLHYEPASRYMDLASGLLVLRLAQNSPEAVLWFRPEVIEHVNWAGDPRKPAEENGNNGSVRLHPRRSFALWREEVRAKSVPWQSVEIDFAAQLRESMSAALLQHRAAEITRLNRELLSSNRELQQFASLASHDLQEPLRTVSSYTQLLLRESEFKDNTNAQSMGVFIVDAVKRMRALITNLLQFAQAGKQDTPSVCIDSGRAFQAAVINLESLLEEKDAEIQIGELPRVCGSEDQLTRVFQNLLANAMKYSRENVPPVIVVNAERVGPNWRFQVKDNGSGFDPQKSETIFESFRRLHPRGTSGTGLGLAICRKIIESYGGRIWAETEPGAGSTFLFTLPAEEYAQASVKVAGIG